MEKPSTENIKIQKSEKIEHINSNEEASDLNPEKLKDKIQTQMIGIARVQDEMISVIQTNPDISEKEFMDALEDKSRTYNFSYEIFEQAKMYFNNYQRRHAVINEFKEKYPNNEELGKELYKATFGEYPTGSIEVLSDPISFTIKCSNLKDFAWSRKSHRDYSEKTPKDVSLLKALNFRLNNDGFAINNFDDQSLPSSYVRPKLSLDSKATDSHEKQHIWYNAIFNGNDKKRTEYILKQIEHRKIASYAVYETLPNEKLVALENSFKQYSKALLDYGYKSVKDELLAIFKDGSTPKFASSVFKSENGSYNYLREIKTPKKGDILQNWKNLELKLSDKNELINNEEISTNMQEIEEKSAEVLNVTKSIINQAQNIIEKYDNNVEKAISAIYSLENQGLTREQIIALFTHIPLEDFYKVAERVINKKSETEKINNLKNEIENSY